MRIEVVTNFGGVETGEKRILPGIYEHDDSRLFGCAKLLVDMGHARVLSDDGRLVTDKVAALMLLDVVRRGSKASEPESEPEGENEGESENGGEGEKVDEVVDDEPKDEKPVDKSTSIHHLGLNSKILKLLSDAGIRTEAELEAMSDDELMAIDGIGHQTVAQIRGKSK